MRIRSTKPEFWRSKRIAGIENWEHRLVFKGLESYVDDNGVGKDDLALIVSDVFPRDLALEPSGTLKRVQVAVNTLHKAGFLWRYTTDGDDLLYISWWEDAQYINRPSKGRLPRPDGTWEYGDSKIGSSLLNPQEPSSNFSAGTGDQGNRGSGEQKKSAPAKPATRAAPKTVEQEVTTAAYESVGKALNYKAVLGIVKWAIHTREENPDRVQQAVIDIYQLGKPITKQTVGQYLDGHLTNSRRPSDRQGEILRREMEAAQQADYNLLEIEQ